MFLRLCFQLFWYEEYKCSNLVLKSSLYQSLVLKFSYDNLGFNTMGFLEHLAKR